MSLARHWQVAQGALKAEKARLARGLHPAEIDFLPAALEVIERPVSPTGRLTAWVLLVLLALTVLWAVIGHVDVVVSAPGKTQPRGNSKLIQSAGSGVVRGIYVHDGDMVKAGQPLVDLDPTLSGAELNESQKGLINVELDAARDSAIADALAGKGLHFAPPAGLDPQIAATQTSLIAAQIAEVNASASGFEAARRSSLADEQAANSQVDKFNETVPILTQERDNMRELDAKGYAPGLRLLELERQQRAEVGDLDVASAQRVKGAADAVKFGNQAVQVREEARRSALSDLAKAQAEIILRREEVTRSSARRQFQRLTSPVDGTVQQLALHTIGGVVEAAKALMVIVPSQNGLEVEARILNKDVGFVHEGQEAAIKFEAFPFTRYGTVPGTVRHISRDAQPDQKLGSVYVATIGLARGTIEVNGRAIPLTAGLNATADIRTGSRSIISYLLSPLQTTVAQAGKEQ